MKGKMREGLYQQDNQTSQCLVMWTVCSGKEVDCRHKPMNVWNLVYIRDGITFGNIDSQYGKI